MVEHSTKVGVDEDVFVKLRKRMVKVA